MTHLPPPPAPFARPRTEMPEDVSLLGGDLGLSDMKLAEGDVAGADIVRALAEIGQVGRRVDAPTGRELLALDNEGPLERPPMIIERAIAEQSGTLKLSAAEARQANPLPGLAVGFSLSLMVGAAFYLVLAGG